MDEYNGPVREMSLVEYCQQLHANHRVNKELKNVLETLLTVLDWIDYNMEWSMDDKLEDRVMKVLDILEPLRED